MGGNAIKGAIRLNKDEYFSLGAEVLELLAPFAQMNDIRCKVVDAYHSKPTFGDMDIVVEDNGTYIEWFDIINEVFHSKEIVHTKNSPVISFEYKGFQIYLILTASKYYDFAVHYYSYNDVCNLIGRITDAMGFKFGHNGLWYHYKNLDQGVDEKLCVTTDFKEALVAIKQLPISSRFGVYIAYIYFFQLLKNIKKLKPKSVLEKRIRVSNTMKVFLFVKGWMRFRFNLL